MMIRALILGCLPLIASLACTTTSTDSAGSGGQPVATGGRVRLPVAGAPAAGGDGGEVAGGAGGAEAVRGGAPGVVGMPGTGGAALGDGGLSGGGVAGVPGGTEGAIGDAGGEGGASGSAGSPHRGGGGATNGTGGVAPIIDCPVMLAGATGREVGGTIPVCCQPSPAEQADTAELLLLLNEYRSASGVSPLAYDVSLESAIQAHLIHMATHAFADHDAPESAVATFAERAQLCGGAAHGENLALGYSTPASVFAAWQASSGHNANLLDPGYTRVGLGVFEGTWGQLFGR